MMTRIVAMLFIGLTLLNQAGAQDLEPRRWAHLPIGLNAAGIGYLYTDAEILFNPTLQITDGEAAINRFSAAYIRTFDWVGKTARFDIMLPYASGQWQGLVEGEFTSVRRRGVGDPRLRLSVILHGAPALKGKDFLDSKAANTPSTVVGAAIALKMPLGKYCDECLINIGANRWSVRPQLGVVHTRGPWSFELTGSVFFFSENDKFQYLGHSTLSQDPLYAIQAHAIYSFPGNWWLGLSTGYANGGHIQIDGVDTRFKVDNWVGGASLGFDVGVAQSVKLTWISGRTQNLVGRNSDNIALSWSIRWMD